MEFRILGPLEARDGSRLVQLRGGKERALLALLLLNARHTLAVDRIVNELWGEETPETAPKMVQILVSKLRKFLPPGTLQTRPPGYALELDPGSLDLEEFERLAAESRAALAEGRAEEAAAGFRAALELWRGPALGEFVSEPFASREGARLEESRLGALEQRVEAELQLGRPDVLVGELEALVVRYPLREGLRRQQMLALYRCGRQAEALAAYQEARRELAEGLGIEPSPALRELERLILTQDPSLQPGTAPSGRDGDDAPARRRLPAASDSRTEVPPAAVGAPRDAPVRYARSGELDIAYQVTGAGPDLVLVPGFVSHLEKDWEEPRHAHFLDRLGSFSRLIRFDKRGTGLSDRPPGVPDLETRMDDVRAVMDAAGSGSAILFGYSEGAPMSVLFAATYPARVVALVLFGGYAKRLDPDEDYPWAPTREARAAYIEQIGDEWGFEADMKTMCPSADEAMTRWWGERCRAAASPGAVRALLEMNSQIDVRDILPSIQAPALVVHRDGDVDANVEEGRYVARRIPGARFVELPGTDHFVAIDPDQIIDVVEPFVAEVAGRAPGADGARVLATIFVSDLVGSTETAARLGDRAWADLLALHHEVVRAEFARYAGDEVDSAGDGFLALFDGPSRAIRAGLAIKQRTDELGLSVRIGLHTGELERRGHAARGIAVHLAARTAAEASPGEVLVTATTRDLVAGSGLVFDDRGERRLKGFDEPRRLYAALA